MRHRAAYSVAQKDIQHAELDTEESVSKISIFEKIRPD